MAVYGLEMSRDFLRLEVVAPERGTTRILCFSKDFSEDFVLIFTKDLSIVRTVNSSHKM